MKKADEHSPAILTGFGVFGLFSSVFLAVKATKKAQEEIEDAKLLSGHEELTAAQTVQATWKCYIWTAISMGVSVACIIGAHSKSNQRITSLMGACNIAQNSIREFADYRKAMQEQLGEKKEQEIYNKTLEQQVQKSNAVVPPAPPENFIEGQAPVPICYDYTFGRYFYASYDQVAAALVKLGNKINGSIGGFASMNDFYDLVNAKCVEQGDKLGWNTETGVPTIPPKECIQYTGTPNGTPCWILKFDNPPVYEYNFFR